METQQEFLQRLLNTLELNEAENAAHVCKVLIRKRLADLRNNAPVMTKEINFDSDGDILWASPRGER